jgi:cytochrome c-type biogenesis protein CcmE
MCVESVGKLPDLFDELIKRTVETTAKIKARTVEAEELAAAVREMYAELAVAKKGRK